MKISVVNPLYNERRYYCRIVSAVRTAPIRDIEIIVVDDGSTDGSRTILKPMSRHCDRVAGVSGKPTAQWSSHVTRRKTVACLDIAFKIVAAAVSRTINLRR